MWLLFTFLTILFWGSADLFYKIGNKSKNKYNHLKTGILVGLVMGIHATIYIIINKIDLNIIELLKYLPISLCYISSMIIGYKGLKYLELSISSPIQNTSGVIVSLLLILFFKEKYDIYFYIALLLIVLGILILSSFELKENEKERKEYRKNNSIKKVIDLTIIFPLLYCFLDGVGGFLDSIYLDKLQIISEDIALISYEYTFFVYGIFTYIYLKYKKENISIKDKPKLIAAILETLGQFCYVYSLSGNSTISLPMIDCYCILSIILSRIFLKEKLSKKQYIGIILVIIGIIILSIFNI